uniref:SAP domain-containing protein n=1 Tax=viral metagenome TaxID=1070528 RepID=A0A6C0JJ77_9ZZZZ
MTLSPALAGGRRRTRRHGKVHAGLKAKTLKRMLKAKGKKTTGKKSTLLKRLKE